MFERTGSQKDLGFQGSRLTNEELQGAKIKRLEFYTPSLHSKTIKFFVWTPKRERLQAPGSMWAQFPPLTHVCDCRLISRKADSN